MNLTSFLQYIKHMFNISYTVNDFIYSDDKYYLAHNSDILCIEILNKITSYGCIGIRYEIIYDYINYLIEQHRYIGDVKDFLDKFVTSHEHTEILRFLFRALDYPRMHPSFVIDPMFVDLNLEPI